MSVEINATATTFEPGSIKTVFEAPVDAVSLAATNRYEVSLDGQRFLINAPSGNYSPTPITVVVNWLAGVKAEH